MPTQEEQFIKQETLEKEESIESIKTPENIEAAVEELEKARKEELTKLAESGQTSQQSVQSIEGSTPKDHQKAKGVADKANIAGQDLARKAQKDTEIVKGQIKEKAPKEKEAPKAKKSLWEKTKDIYAKKDEYWEKTKEIFTNDEIGNQVTKTMAGTVASLGGVKSLYDVPAYFRQRFMVRGIAGQGKGLAGSAEELLESSWKMRKGEGEKGDVKKAIEDLNKRIEMTKEGAQKGSEQRKLIAKLIRENRTQERMQKEGRQEEMTKILDDYTNTKVTGIQAARESLNTALVASGALAFRGISYGILDGVERCQKLTQVAGREGEDKNVDIMRDVIAGSIKETWDEIRLKDTSEQQDKTKMQKGLDAIKGFGKIARYVGMGIMGATEVDIKTGGAKPEIEFGGGRVSHDKDELLKMFAGKTTFSDVGNNFALSIERMAKLPERLGQMAEVGAEKIGQGLATILDLIIGEAHAGDAETRLETGERQSNFQINQQAQAQRIIEALANANAKGHTTAVIPGIAGPKVFQVLVGQGNLQAQEAELPSEEQIEKVSTPVEVAGAIEAPMTPNQELVNKIDSHIEEDEKIIVLQNPNEDYNTVFTIKEVHNDGRIEYFIGNGGDSKILTPNKQGDLTNSDGDVYYFKDDPRLKPEEATEPVEPVAPATRTETESVAPSPTRPEPRDAVESRVARPMPPERMTVPPTREEPFPIRRTRGSIRVQESAPPDFAQPGIEPTAPKQIIDQPLLKDIEATVNKENGHIEIEFSKKYPAMDQNLRRIVANLVPQKYLKGGFDNLEKAKIENVEANLRNLIQGKTQQINITDLPPITAADIQRLAQESNGKLVITNYDGLSEKVGQLFARAEQVITLESGAVAEACKTSDSKWQEMARGASEGRRMEAVQVPSPPQPELREPLLMTTEPPKTTDEQPPVVSAEEIVAALTPQQPEVEPTIPTEEVAPSMPEDTLTKQEVSIANSFGYHNISEAGFKTPFDYKTPDGQINKGIVFKDEKIVGFRKDNDVLIMETIDKDGPQEYRLEQTVDTIDIYQKVGDKWNHAIHGTRAEGGAVVEPQLEAFKDQIDFNSREQVSLEMERIEQIEAPQIAILESAIENSRGLLEDYLEVYIEEPQEQFIYLKNKIGSQELENIKKYLGNNGYRIEGYKGYNNLYPQKIVEITTDKEIAWQSHSRSMNYLEDYEPNNLRSDLSKTLKISEDAMNYNIEITDLFSEYAKLKILIRELETMKNFEQYGENDKEYTRLGFRDEEKDYLRGLWSEIQNKKSEIHDLEEELTGKNPLYKQLKEAADLFGHTHGPDHRS